MKMKLSRVLTLSTALATGLAVPALAQQGFDLDEITFTANRKETELKRTGATVSVVTADEITASGAVTLVDVLKSLPGLSVAQAGGPGKATNVRLRGLPERYIAVFVDGIRVDDPSQLQTQTEFSSLMAADIDRIEVLRGSQSALWGGSAVAGVVNITSRKAERDGWSQSSALEAGSYSTLSGRYGAYYRDDRLNFAFTLSHLQTEGFSAVNTLPVDPTFEADALRTTRLSFSSEYKATDALTLGASGYYRWFESEYDNFGSNAAAANADNLGIGSEYAVRAFGRFENGALTHEVSASFFNTNRQDFAPRGTDTGTWNGQRFELAYQGGYQVSSALDLSFGLDHKIEVATIRGTGPNRTALTGIWGQALWAPSEQLDVALSARADISSGFGTFPSGRAAVAWRPTATLTLRASAARGFRAPSFNELLGNPVWGIAPNPGAAPETSTSFEVGAQYSPSDRFSLSATLFDIAVDNQLTYCGAAAQPWAAACPAPVPAGFSNMYQNLPGISRSQGVELGAQLAVTDRQAISANYTYTNWRLPSGARQARVPEHDLTLALTSRWTDRFSTNLGLQHVAGRTDVAPYTVVNLRLNYALTDTADLTLKVDNLLDAQYQSVPNYATSGRAFYVGLAARF